MIEEESSETMEILEDPGDVQPLNYDRMFLEKARLTPKVHFFAPLRVLSLIQNWLTPDYSLISPVINNFQCPHF